MPVSIAKNPNGGYQVATPNGVHAKDTTARKAMAQRKLLNAIDHGWTPGKQSKKSVAMAARATQKI